MKFCLVPLALLATAVLAAPPIKKEWKNPECASGNCEIEGMRISVQASLSPQFGMTTMVADMKARKPEFLKNYAFVQYIRGCVFESSKNGPIRLAAREYLGQSGLPFQHKTWQVDSSQRDPIYWSTRNPGFDPIRGFTIPRNANYMVSDPSINEEDRWGGKESNVLDNRLYVKDMPTGGSTSTSSTGVKAVNSSLEFKICLYKIENIPTTVDSSTGMLPDPVACLEWNAHYIYNFPLRRFATISSVHPYCLNQ